MYLEVDVIPFEWAHCLNGAAILVVNMQSNIQISWSQIILVVNLWDVNKFWPTFTFVIDHLPKIFVEFIIQ